VAFRAYRAPPVTLGSEAQVDHARACVHAVEDRLREFFGRCARHGFAQFEGARKLKRANLRESTFCAGLYGAILESALAWETREDINGAVRAAELREPSGSQLERWRNARLLPSVRQLPAAYRGSTVEYPPGTA
jgi:hypothetical protein